MADLLPQRVEKGIQIPDIHNQEVAEPGFETPVEARAEEQREDVQVEAGQTRDAAAEMQHIQSLRQGPLATAPLPQGAVSPKDIDEIKKILFPNIDFTKENPTPEQLVTALLLHHNMDTQKAHDWVEFLAHNQEDVSA
jgi:hypothetical protein